jgi:hypothetical protein
MLNLHRLISGSSTTLTSHPTYAPTYARKDDEPGPIRAQDINRGRLSQWTADMRGTSSISYTGPEAAFDQAHYYVADTVSIRGISSEVSRPVRPRYSEPEYHRYRDLSNQRAFSVYYRVYAEDGAIPAACPAYTDDLYLGRILPELVTPPHTAANLKYCLSGFENIDENIATSLFRSCSSQTSMDDNCRVSIFSKNFPGCTPDQPIALVAMLPGADRRPLGAEASHLLSQEGPTPFKARYRKCFERLFRTTT